MFSDSLKNSLRELGIDLDPSRPEEARAAIVARFTSFHPDKTGGKFTDGEQERTYLSLQKLLDQFDKEISAASQMIPLDQLARQIEAIKSAQAGALALLKNVQQAESLGGHYRRYLRRKYALPKITSAIFASLCLALISLMGSFKSNTLYKTVLNYYTRESRARLTASSIEELTKLNWESLRIGMARQNVMSADYQSKEFLEERENRRRDTRHVGGIDYLLPAGVLYSSANHQVPSDIVDSYNNSLISNQFDVFAPEEPKIIKGAIDGITADIEEVTPQIDQIKKPYERFVKDSDENKFEDLSMVRAMLRALLRDYEILAADYAAGKKRVIEDAEAAMIRDLTILLIIAVLFFALVWAREQSDDRWVEYLSSDEGLEEVFNRIHSDTKIVSRTPPRFSLREFSGKVSSKDVPAFLAPVLGKRLDMKPLGQLTSLLISKLVEQGRISKPAPPSRETWFEIKTGGDHASGGEKTSTTGGYSH